MSDKDRFEEALEKFMQHTFTYNKENIKIMFTYEIYTNKYSTIVIAHSMADALEQFQEDDPAAEVLACVNVIYRKEFFDSTEPEDRPY